jgi:hypothetical protein
MDITDRYKYYSFDSENAILYHEVTDENFGDKGSFVTSLSQFATLSETYEPKSLVIKILKKPGYYELELQDFMQKSIFPSIVNSHVRKVAFYVPNRDYLVDLMVHESEETIMVSFFSDLESARRWVLGLPDPD